MIGFLDSGIGGLTVLRSFLYVLGDVDVIYLADQARCPYSSKSEEAIRQYARQWTQWLFDNGATIVVLASNTLTTHAIRYLQSEAFPDRKILGVTLPAAERVRESMYSKIGLLTTEDSLHVKAYKDRVGILSADLQVSEARVPQLITPIENGDDFSDEIDALLLGAKQQMDDDIEALVLWCTHCPLVLGAIARVWPHIPIVDPARESARKFIAYLEKHPEIRQNIDFARKTHLATTGDTDIFGGQVEMIFEGFGEFASRDVEITAICIEKI